MSYSYDTKSQGADIKARVSSATGKQAENYNSALQDMLKQDIKPSNGHKYSPHDVFSFLLDNFTPKASRERGTGEDVLNRIDEVVQAQIELNQTTKKTYTIGGKSKNAVTVLYEQRAITPRFIRDAAGVNKAACDEYLQAHGDEIAEHNAWLVSNCGYEVDSDTQRAIENFNRKTGKAQKSAEG